MNWSDQYTNNALNNAELSRHDAVHVQTKLGNIIMDYDARNGPVTNKIKQASWLVDTDLLAQAATAKAEGDTEKYLHLMDGARSQLYKELIVEGAKQDKLVQDAGYIPPSQVLLSKHTLSAAGGLGQVLQTAQEIVRQTKYQTKVSGVFYRTEKYQAVNVVNKISTNDLTTKGSIDLQLPLGHKEIGDDQTPEPTKPFFDTFEKQIFADSFHYGFGMREKSDAFINIVERMTSKVPGVMLRMKNEKIMKAINAVRGTASSGKWNTYLADHDIVSVDAAKHVEDDVNAIEDFEGEIAFLATRGVIRGYQRNVQGRNVTSTKSNQPAANRSGTLEYNPEGTYYVENTAAPGSFITIAKDAYMDHYIGPEIDVAYKDQFKPSNFEGRIMFHFNGIQEKVTSALKKRTGVI